MTDCVIDASALVLAVAGKTEAADALRTRLPGMRRHAPHLIDAEVGNVLRRHELGGRLTGSEAAASLEVAGVLVDYRYPHAGALTRQAWRLRGNLSFYDALYVALASALNLPLLTADGRLSRAPGLPCEVELATRS